MPSPDSLDRREAWRWANDYFGMSLQIRGGGTASSSSPPSPRLTGAVDRLERLALAGVIAHPGLLPTLIAITPEHFRDETNRRLRDHLVDGTEPGGKELELLAELDALVPQRGDRRIDGEGVLAAPLRAGDLGRAPARRPCAYG